MASWYRFCRSSRLTPAVAMEQYTKPAVQKSERLSSVMTLEAPADAHSGPGAVHNACARQNNKVNDIILASAWGQQAHAEGRRPSTA